MTGVDPIRLELLRNLFEAAAEEMGLVLQRASFSANIKERRDFSCALFDPRGQLLAQAAHIPVHLGSMPASVRAVLDTLGGLEEGDVAIVNDPFAGGSHLPDITVVSAIYASRRLIGFAANRAHHADVGGSTPGSMTLSTHIDEEGVRLAPQFLLKRGAKVEETFAKLLWAVRSPDERLGDLEAQLASLAIGTRRLQEMVVKRGATEVAEYGSALLDYAERFTRAAVASLPVGVYEAEDHLDNDGITDALIRLHCRLTIEGVPASHATVDFTFSDNAVAGPLNCPASVTQSAAWYCFACLVHALGHSVPLNAGVFRPVTVITRPGSVVHAQYPSPVVAGNTETSQRVVDVVFRALAQAAPSMVPAASCGTMSSVALGNATYTYYETIGGGSGGGPLGKGAHAVQCHMTNTLNTPAEALELQYPLRVERFERRRNSGGAGQSAGGDGITRALRALAPTTGTLLTDRRTTRPYGLNAESGQPGQNSITRADGTVELLPGKSEFSLSPGDTLTIATPGGGAWNS